MSSCVSYEVDYLCCHTLSYTVDSFICSASQWSGDVISKWWAADTVWFTNAVCKLLHFESTNNTLVSYTQKITICNVFSFASIIDGAHHNKNLILMGDIHASTLCENSKNCPMAHGGHFMQYDKWFCVSEGWTFVWCVDVWVYIRERQIKWGKGNRAVNCTC